MAEESSGKEASAETEDLASKLPEFPPEENDEMDSTERLRTIISFSGVGLLLHCLFAIVISGSQDILAGTYIPTTAVVIAHVGPMALVQFTFPWFMQNMSYFIRVFIVFGFMASGLLVIVFVESPYAKIGGVAVNAVSHALGEITFLALGAFYGEIAVTSFAAGSGAGILIGPVYYLGLTAWACMSPQQAMSIASGGSILLLVFYYVLNKDRIKSHAIAATYNSVRYNSVPTNNNGNLWKLSWGEKFSAAWKIFPLMVALFLSYISQLLTIQAVFTTLSFPSSPFPPKDHYVYYVVMDGVGEFLSRSYLSVIAYFRPELAHKIVIRRTWIVSLLLVAVFALAMCASWFRFFDSVVLVLVLSLVVGTLSGTVYANSLLNIKETIEPRYQEFCLGLVTVGLTAGSLIGSFIGLKLEPILRKHCEKSETKDVHYCFTRREKRIWTVAVCEGKTIRRPIKIK